VSPNLPTTPERRHSIAGVLASLTGSAGSPTTGVSPPDDAMRRIRDKFGVHDGRIPGDE
jgi:hypothetical protein